MTPLKIMILSFYLFFSHALYASDILTLPKAEDVKVHSSVLHPSQYPHGAPYLLLTCVDFRLQDEMKDFMEQRGLIDKYDNIELPGASLGIDDPKNPEWSDTFKQSLEVLKRLHKFQRVIIMDHRNCGMYNAVYQRDISQNPDEEYTLHHQHLHHVKEIIKQQHPDLEIELLLMDLDGHVHTVEELN